MSEKEKERVVEEEEEEEEIIDHLLHEHPLILVETRREDRCFGCDSRFSSGEKGYGCSKKCGYGEVLHEECAKMARNIRHELHPQHMLIQQYGSYMWECTVCRKYTWRGIRYKCSECLFGMHLRCAQASGMIDDEKQSQCVRRVIHHPSHPEHELRLWSRSGSFKCDACGTTRRGRFCTCIACEYLIHRRCADSPHTIKREDHHHSLSLCFHLPLEYIIYDYKCEVCYQCFMPKNWIYHCELCRYIVHIKCAFKKSPRSITNNAANEKGIICFPLNDVAEELIRAFVVRQRGEIPLPPIIPHDEDRYDFFHHKHPLTLLSSSSSSSSTHGDQTQEEEEEEDDNEDYGKRPELICNGCITPISSSSSSSDKHYYYMSCRECKYYLHWECFHLPRELPSLPILHDADHRLILQSCDKLKPWEDHQCSVCDCYTNGLYYACTTCYFKADIKCASMPETIYHAAHPHHLLTLLSRDALRHRKIALGMSCAANCDYFIRYDWYDCYACDSCEFFLDVRCAALPASTSSRRWDKQHPLLLTHDANLNHPGGFCCDQCEREMNPKRWMYHCRHCDLSFHPDCFPLTSGHYKNIKFGQQYHVIKGEAAHPHPLTHQLLTTKRRCDHCHEKRHRCLGFYCALCNFFICFHYCGEKLIESGNIQAFD